MDRNKEIQDLLAARLTSPFSAVQRTRTWRLILWICWCFLHLLVKLVHLVTQSIHKLQCYFILFRYTFNHVPLGLSKLQSVAIVVDSGEAFQISKVVALIRWLSKFGVKHISLYDMDGVMKESKKFLVTNWSDLSLREWKAYFMIAMGFLHDLQKLNALVYVQEVDKKIASRDEKFVELEWLSYPDGKEAVARAARYISSRYSKPVELDAQQSKQAILEADVDKALKAVGSSGPEPDLLFIFGPARCHLGFPAWRLRYTEIIHMGSLRTSSFSALLKVFYDFSKKHQNYGK